MRSRFAGSSTVASRNLKSDALKGHMGTHHFVFWLQGIEDITDELEDRLFEAGCDDALIGSFNSHVFLEFDRDAPNAASAVASALKDVAKAGIGVAGIRGEHLVTASEIARRTGRSRASISQLIQGERGPGGFPPPRNVSGGTHTWDWFDVEAWFARHEGATPDESGDSEIRNLELAFELLKRVPDKRKRDEMFRALSSAD